MDVKNNHSSDSEIEEKLMKELRKDSSKLNFSWSKLVNKGFSSFMMLILLVAVFVQAIEISQLKGSLDGRILKSVVASSDSQVVQPSPNAVPGLQQQVGGC